MAAFGSCTSILWRDRPSGQGTPDTERCESVCVFSTNLKFSRLGNSVQEKLLNAFWENVAKERKRGGSYCRWQEGFRVLGLCPQLGGLLQASLGLVGEWVATLLGLQ
ncbi:hypothetical protein BDL97_07G070800 [Sphagnum fallax]|nr:hypothetical protein BDL97_07G070800 [Sphagnum fallax]